MIGIYLIKIGLTTLEGRKQIYVDYKKNIVAGSWARSDNKTESVFH